MFRNKKQCIWDYRALEEADEDTSTLRMRDPEHIQTVHAMSVFYLTTNAYHWPQLLPPGVSEVG